MGGSEMDQIEEDIATGIFRVRETCVWPTDFPDNWLLDCHRNIKGHHLTLRLPADLEGYHWTGHHW